MANTDRSRSSGNFSDQTMGAYKAPPFPHPLPYPQSQKLENKIKNWKSPMVSTQLPNRRLFLFSLPLSGFLLLPTSSADKFAYGSSYEPVSTAERNASAAISQRVSEAVDLLEKGRELQAQGDFNAALRYFSQVVESYKDFAFSDYARVGRALALYEIGDRDEAIAEMEDVSISLKGYPEVHAALAAALYADKHAPLLAENQFTIATLLDPHFTDISYVRDSKHWPPSLITSLQHFITLS